jgi:hypothetical protein
MFWLKAIQRVSLKSHPLAQSSHRYMFVWVRCRSQQVWLSLRREAICRRSQVAWQFLPRQACYPCRSNRLPRIRCSCPRHRDTGSNGCSYWLRDPRPDSGFFS